jgi:hypothetical protein
MHTSLFTGRKSVRRESHPPVRRGRSVPGLLGHGHKEQGRKESNPLGQGWSLTALPGARPCRTAEGTGLEPARASRLARLPTGCHRASWLALPYRAVPAELEPASVWVTASRTTVVLQDSEVSADRTGIEPERARRTPFPRAYDRCAQSEANPVRQFRRLGSSQRPSPFRGDARTV